MLLVDDFGVEYVGERHARHLQMALEENYEITMDWEGKHMLALTLNGTTRQSIKTEKHASQ